MDNKLREYSKAMCKLAASYSAPIYWPICKTDPSRVKNGTIFFLNTGNKLLAVTNNHVYEKFLKTRISNDCMIMNLTFNLEKRLVDKSKIYDIATFEIYQNEIDRVFNRQWFESNICSRYHKPLNSDIFVPLDRVPSSETDDSGLNNKKNACSYFPARKLNDVSINESVFFVGYPGAEKLSNKACELNFGIGAVLANVKRNTDNKITMQLDFENSISIFGSKLPTEYDFGGVSGSALFVLDESSKDNPDSSIVTPRLCGVVKEAGKNFPIIYASRADVIQSNGKIQIL